METGQYSDRQIEKWARSLSYFRLKLGAPDPRLFDFDEVLVALSFADRRGLEEICGALGIRLRLKNNDKRDSDENRDESLVHQFPDMIQPGKSLICGETAFVWVYADRLTVSLSAVGAKNEKPTVTDAVIESCRKIERKIGQIKERVLDPPVDTELCICPKYHPDIWRGPS